jgi:hypothetical protein
MNRKRWALLLKKDNTVDVYYITTSGKYQKKGSLTHTYVSSPEKISEIVDDQVAADTWIHAVTAVLHKVLVKEQDEDGVVYGVIDEYGGFFEPDMVTIVYMVKLMIDHVFTLLVEAQANVA